jgi:hypothetical protein
MSRFGAKTEAGERYRDYDTGDGYVYRWWKTGEITILQSPRGGAGLLLTQDTHPEAWAAITAQLRAMKARRVSQAILTVAKAATDAAVSRRKSRSRGASPPPPTFDVDVEEPPSTFPWGWAAAAAVVVAGALAFRSSR